MLVVAAAAVAVGLGGVATAAVAGGCVSQSLGDDGSCLPQSAWQAKAEAACGAAGMELSTMAVSSRCSKVRFRKASFECCPAVDEEVCCSDAVGYSLTSSTACAGKAMPAARCSTEVCCAAGDGSVVWAELQTCAKGSMVARATCQAEVCCQALGGALATVTAAECSPAATIGAGACPDPVDEPLTYPIVDSGQDRCYGTTEEISCPDAGAALSGQDAQYHGNTFSYVDNGDGTVTDLVTGLMWQQDPGAKMTLDEALAGVASFTLAGHDDWRLPTIKELYSLIDFRGTDPSCCETLADCPDLVPFVDTDYFAFEYGDTSAGERVIDAQYASDTLYVSTTMSGDETLFGVNLADGRIKGYGTSAPFGGGGGKTFFVMYVRGGDAYGENAFVDGGDGTVLDQATGLEWMQLDSGHLGAGDAGDGGLDWEQALGWCEALDYAGQDDWRLPSAKELQSIVDYTRSPDTTGTAAIDPIFEVTGIIAEGGDPDFPSYWTSTSHAGVNAMADSAVYVCFGRALGWMQDQMTGTYTLMDVHGAGSQRCDSKVGDPSAFPYGFGPQGDVVRIYHHVRCVRDGATFENIEPTSKVPDAGANACAGAPGGSGETGGTATCGDGVCQPGEAGSCSADCSGGPGGVLPTCDMVPPGMPCCGDGFCGGPETAANCAADCG